MSEASVPLMASPPEETDTSLQTNASDSEAKAKQTPPPSSSPPPGQSPQPPSPPAPEPPTPSPPPADPPKDEPSSSPPPPDSPPPPPPPESSPSPPPIDSSPPPSSPPPSSPPPTSSPPPSNTSPPPPSIAFSPPPPLVPPPTTGSPPGAPVFSPPPPKAIASQAPPSPHNPPRSPSTPRPEGASGGPPSPPPSDSDSTMHGVMITGIVVGGVVIVALSIVIMCLICSKRRKKPQYYMDPGHPPKGGKQYYNDPAQWHSPRPIDQIQLPPPPGNFIGTPVGGVGGWGAPPMAPPANTSGDFSSGYSSQHPTQMQPPSPNMGGITQFKYEELAAATNGFSQSNLLGQGGFGLVHKGVLTDRKEVAVKSLKSGSGQGEREFQAEVEIISRVHHRHLVSLVGYCIANQQRMLVYEFVPNKTLEFHLHGKGQPVIDWATRLRIAVGSAKGLAYLHEDCLPRIIHRDIKAANILLDYNFEAMVADFGLAKLTTDNFTHVSTRVMGTFGYLAPEYASSGKLTEKSDVFSFGVMLLELITGRRPVDTTNRFMEDSLVDWARPLLSKAMEDGNYATLVDPRLEGNYIPHEMACMVTCAAASIRHSARRRPKMSQIVRALEGDSSLEDLNEGVKPGQSTVYNNPNGGTEAYDTRAYNADMLRFKKMVMSSQDFNSSEYGATSEYGLNPSSSSGGDSREMGKTSFETKNPNDI